MTELTRYMVPGGHGIEAHKAGLLYIRDEVDAFIAKQAAEIARLRGAMRLAMPIMEAAVSFERVAEEYITASQYELNAALSEPSATIFVSGKEALQSARAALDAKP